MRASETDGSAEGLKRLIDGEAMRKQGRERENEREGVGCEGGGESAKQRANPLSGYEGVAQAGHAEVSMATSGDKSSRSIPE